MKKINMVVWGTLLLCLCTALPVAAQNIELENAVVRTVVSGQSLAATQDLQQTIFYMQGVQTPRERDGVLRMATQAIQAGADVRAELVIEPGTRLSVLEAIVDGGSKYNPDYFANLYNLVVAHGANPNQDLHGPYVALAQKLPLEQNQVWQEIAATTQAPITPATQEPKRHIVSRPVTIHIPHEYNDYSCRKLAKMQQNGTLPSPTFTYGQPEWKEYESVTSGSHRVLTITIPQEYDQYSCRKLKKMRQNGTLPKPTFTYGTEK